MPPRLPGSSPVDRAFSTGEDAGRYLGRLPERVGNGSRIAPAHGCPSHARVRLRPRSAPAQSWLSKFGQADEWSFCLRAARMAREQERR
jgi:hypothetical protein